MKRDLRVLTAPTFLLGLGVLIANDFILKQLFHNWLTGKLSDFAGLFVFPLFWTAFFPRHRNSIYAATAAAFVFWKSPYSHQLIEIWNSSMPWGIARTVDASDLLALVALYASARYSRRFSRPTQTTSQGRARKWATCGVSVVAVIAFTATSYRTNFEYENQQFIFADSEPGLVKRLEKLSDSIFQGNDWSSKPAPAEYTIRFKTECCCGAIHGLIELAPLDTYRTRLTLRKLEHHCPGDENDKEKMLTLFLHDIVEKLQDDIDAHPTERSRENLDQPRRRKD